MTFDHPEVEETSEDAKQAVKICRALYSVLRAMCIAIGWSPIRGYFVLRRLCRAFEQAFSIDPEAVKYTTEKPSSVHDLDEKRYKPSTDPSKFN